jgi:hypothetical protein
LVQKPKGKRQFRKPRYRWEGNIKTGLQEVGWEGHVASIGDRTGACRVWYGNLRERDSLEGPGIDGRVILK